MATERNPPGTSVNNIVSIETAAEVLCMFPFVHVLFSSSSQEFSGANLPNVHVMLYCGEITNTAD